MSASDDPCIVDGEFKVASRHDRLGIQRAFVGYGKSEDACARSPCEFSPPDPPRQLSKLGIPMQALQRRLPRYLY